MSDQNTYTIYILKLRPYRASKQAFARIIKICICVSYSWLFPWNRAISKEERAQEWTNKRRFYYSIYLYSINSLHVQQFRARNTWRSALRSNERRQTKSQRCSMLPQSAIKICTCISFVSDSMSVYTPHTAHSAQVIWFSFISCIWQCNRIHIHTYGSFFLFFGYESLYLSISFSGRIEWLTRPFAGLLLYRRWPCLIVLSFRVFVAQAVFRLSIGTYKYTRIRSRSTIERFCGPYCLLRCAHNNSSIRLNWI